MKQTREDRGCIGVIFHEKNPQRSLKALARGRSRAGLDRIRRARGRDLIRVAAVEWKRQSKGAATAFPFTHYAESALVRFGDRLADRKTEADPAKLPRDLAIALLEGIEDAVELRGTNADAGVLDFNRRYPIGRFRP